MNGDQGFFPRGVGNTSSNNNSAGSFITSGHNVTGSSHYSSPHESMARGFGGYPTQQALLSSRLPMHGMPPPRLPSQRVMSSHSPVSQQMQMANQTVMSGMMPPGPPSISSRLMQPGGASPVNLSPGVTRRPMLPNDNDHQRPIMEHLHHVSMDHGMNSTTHYFSSKSHEEFRKLQESGSLEKPPWYLVPPVPDHLRGPSSGKASGRLLPSMLSKSRTNNFYIDTDLRNTLLNRLHATLLQADEKLASHFPDSVSEFTNIIPIEKPSMWMPSNTYRFTSLCVKAFNLSENTTHLLRIIKNCPVPMTNSNQSLLAKLASSQHPNIVPVRALFTSDDFGAEPVTVFVFEFIPCAATLQQRHMSDPLKLTGYASPFNVDRVPRPVSAVKSAVERTMMSEASLAAYFVQLLSGLRHIHKTLGMAFRYLDPTKVLVTEGQRLRINCVGLADFLMPLNEANVEMFQKKDLHLLGQLMIGLACGTPVSISDPSLINTSLDMVRQTYSMDISNLIIQLWQEDITDIDQAITALAARAFDHSTSLHAMTDHLESQLTKQMESDRLFRLVCKIATVCERNELGAEAEWSETEGRYLLKLFRDFVFHQTDHGGAPYLDLSHIVSCMNKLDMASPEKIYMVSREGQNVIIASYAELKRCLDDSYQYLMNKQIQSQQALLSDHLAKMQLDSENDGGRRN